MQRQAGYYRFPTIADDRVVFVCEDDLWTVPAQGGTARRLTSGLGTMSSPALSPDGQWLAFGGREEGPTEVYVMPAAGGPAQRLTYLGSPMLRVTGWMPDGRIVFVSNAASAHLQRVQPFAIAVEGGIPQALPTGPAVSISFGPNNGCVLGRNEVDPARWKRYRGGTAGNLWIDPQGEGDFSPLIELPGNLALPLWVGDRIYFHSDHEGIGNLYSCTPQGEDLKRHTHHERFYIRFPSSDRQRIVYQHGSDLFLFNPEKDASEKIEIAFHSARTQRNRKFVKAARYLETYALHPEGHQVVVTARGRAFSFGNWDGPVQQCGEPDDTRYRLAQWLHDGQRLVLVSDRDGEETLELHDANLPQVVERLSGLDLGQIHTLVASPSAHQVALTNQRNELIVVTLDTQEVQVADHSPYGSISGISWSPDGCWIAYSFSDTYQTRLIKLFNLKTQEASAVTRPILTDFAPTFDPQGKYLYFLSSREFNPVYDNLHFDLGFPRGVRPCLLTLSKDTLSPFFLEPKAPDQKTDENDKTGEEKQEALVVKVDLEGIQSRILSFPVPEGRYVQLKAMKDKVLWTVWPIEGALGQNWRSTVPEAKGRLEAFDFETQKTETLVNQMSGFTLSQNGKTLIYRSNNRLRIQKAGVKADKKTADKPPGKESGWVQLDRIRLLVHPPAEWRQMLREAWRLQRDNFWDEQMAQLDWSAVYERYLPLVERVSTRSEFSDLVWEMQGELGTSHAYEFGGDYRAAPHYALGFLGADLSLDKASGLWHIQRIVQGDPWDVEKTSPLLRPGLNVKAGETLLAVDGCPVNASVSPYERLIHRAGAQVRLTLGDANGGTPRTMTVKTLRDERHARYRDWVEANRAYVHEKTDGQVGYLHIPNMMALGYAEFHRGFLAELTRDGLLVDVRFNGGGHVSQLLLEKLGRKRIGFGKTRWSSHRPFPYESPGGPMVCLTNEFAGSDGDIFSHSFKLLGYGPLIGKRTWGGVVGINPSRRLADGGMTSQPAFAFWFEDVGWNVENYGTDPDIEVEMRPQDYVNGKDPQLDRAIEESLKLLAENPPKQPHFEKAPSRALPKLPK